MKRHARASAFPCPGGQSPVIEVQTIVANVARPFSDRLSAQLSISISTGSFSRKWADSLVDSNLAAILPPPPKRDPQDG